MPPNARQLELKDTVGGHRGAETGSSRYSATIRHGDLLARLTVASRHPFDRLLIVQALDEGLTILTSDRAFEPYRVPVVWA